MPQAIETGAACKRSLVGFATVDEVVQPAKSLYPRAQGSLRFEKYNVCEETRNWLPHVYKMSYENTYNQKARQDLA